MDVDLENKGANHIKALVILWRWVGSADSFQGLSIVHAARLVRRWKGKRNRRWLVW